LETVFGYAFQTGLEPVIASLSPLSAGIAGVSYYKINFVKEKRGWGK
jgi:hypothetical protein